MAYKTRVKPTQMAITGSSADAESSISVNSTFLVQNASVGGGVVKTVTAAVLQDFMDPDIEESTSSGDQVIVFAPMTGDRIPLVADSDGLLYNSSTAKMTLGGDIQVGGHIVADADEAKNIFAAVTTPGNAITIGGGADVVLGGDLQLGATGLIEDASGHTRFTATDSGPTILGAADGTAGLTLAANNSLVTIAGDLTVSGNDLDFNSGNANIGASIGSSNLTLGGESTTVVIPGNLDVNGTTTTIDTQNLLVKDPLLVLARENSGSATIDQGLVFMRAGDNQAFLWDESEDEFALGATADSGSTSGNVTLSAYAGLHIGALDADAASKIASLQVEDLTSGRVVLAGSGGELEDNGNLTYDGSHLSANSVKVGDLTVGRVTFAGAAGDLSDDSSLTWNSGFQILAVTGTVGATNVSASNFVKAGGALQAGGAVDFTSAAGSSGAADLDVAGYAQFAGIAEFDSQLKADGAVDFTGTGGSSGGADFDVAGYAQFAGTVELDGTVDIDGAVTFDNASVQFTALSALAASGVNSGQDTILIQDNGTAKEVTFPQFGSYLADGNGSDGGGLQVNAAGVLSIDPVIDLYSSGSAKKAEAGQNAAAGEISFDLVTCSLSQTALSDSIQVYLNGLLLCPSSSAASGAFDYKEFASASPQRIELIDAIDDSQDLIQIRYIKK